MKRYAQIFILTSIFISAFSMLGMQQVRAEKYRHTRHAKLHKSSLYISASYAFPFIVKAKDINGLHLAYDSEPEDLAKLVKKYEKDYNGKEATFDTRRAGLSFAIGVKTSGIFRLQMDLGIMQGKKNLTDEFEKTPFYSTATSNEYKTMFLTTKTIYLIPKVYIDLVRSTKLVPYVGVGFGGAMNIAYFQESLLLGRGGGAFATDAKFFSGFSGIYQLAAGARIRVAEAMYLNLEVQHNGIVNASEANNPRYTTANIGLMYMWK